MNPLRHRYRLAGLLAGLACGLLFSLPARADLEKVRGSGALKVAVYKDFPPFSALREGQFEGVDVALAEALAAKLGVRLSLMPFDAGESMGDDLRNMVWRGHYLGYGPADVMLHVPVDRRFMASQPQSLIFAPYHREAYTLVHELKRLPEVRSAADLKDVAVAAEQGAAAASALLGADGGALRASVRMFSSGREAMQALLAGEVAAAMVTRVQAESELAKSGAAAPRFALSPLQLNGLPPQGWVLGMAVKAEHQALARALDEALAEIVRSGELAAIFKRQGATLSPP